MNITLKTQAESADLLIIPVPKTDELAQTLAAIAGRIGLSVTVLQTDFEAGLHEVLPVYQPTGPKVYLLGLGEKPGSLAWLKAFRKLFFNQKNKLPTRVSVDLNGVDGDLIEAAVMGILGGEYDLRLYQTDKTGASVFFAETGELTLLVAEATLDVAQDAVGRAEILAEAQRQMLDLTNAPGNYTTPQTLADWAVASGRRCGYDVKLLNKDELERQGLGALLSVGRGSEQPPVLIVAEYKPDVTTHTVGLVGKGVTFDTGGISIKTSASMHYMKSDMGGAAAVLGTMEAAARLKLPVHLIGIVPAVENMVDGRATRPGDVITSYLGKTIEIIDTDAEGRVILADGLGYMIRNFQLDVLIDLATLTGSVIAALGYHAAGLFTQNDELAAQLIAAADRTGERLWRLPLWDVYREDIKSDVADVKNFSGKPLAGAISAAKFLEVFTEKHPVWAHLDIAGTAFADTEFGSQKNATGFGIRLLVDYLRRLASSAA
ncbi:MAG: leucyl aminopeptidase [Bacteroidetes bacterium]|nr:leucyl aminopeptidase [Fibrella sp.]